MERRRREEGRLQWVGSGQGTLMTQEMGPVSSTGENVERDVGRAASNLSVFTYKSGPHVPFFSAMSHMFFQHSLGCIFPLSKFYRTEQIRKKNLVWFCHDPSRKI